MPQRGAVAVSSRLAGRDEGQADPSPGPTTFPSDTICSGNLLNDINAASLPVTGEDAPNLCNDAHDCSLARRLAPMCHDRSISSR